MIEVYAVDDHKMLIDSFTEHFTSIQDIKVIGYSLSGSAAIDSLNPKDRQSNPDIVLLDIGLGDMNGVECAKQLLKNDPKLKIIGLSTYMQASIVKKMLKTGAKGYVSKSTDLSQLEHAIREVMNGNTYLDQQIQQSLVNSVMQLKPTKSKEIIPKMTKREKEVLVLIADEYNTKEIASSLFISINTVETHRKNLISKFNVKNSIGLVRKAMQLKLLED